MFKALIIVFLSYQASAKVTIIIPKIDEYSNPEKPGYINTIIKSLNLETEATLIYAPLKRAIYKYSQEKKDCFLGGDKKITKLYMPQIDLKDVINSKPFLSVQSKIFTIEKIICDPQKLSGMDVLIHSGYPLARFIDLDKLNSHKEMNNRVYAFKMVREKRADAFVGFVPPNDKQYKGLKFCQNKYLTQHSETIQCHRNTKTEKTIEKINRKIEKMYQNGSLEKLIKEWFPTKYEQFMIKK